MENNLVNWLKRYGLELKNINLKISFRESIVHYGKYPIHIACMERNKYILLELLSRNTSLHEITKIEKRNVLHYCCFANLELVKIVYSQSTKYLLFIQDYREMTPLDVALHYNKTDIIFYFIEIGLFNDNELLIKYLYRLEAINNSILSSIQKNKFNLLLKIVFDVCLKNINDYFNFSIKIEPLFKLHYLYLSYLNGIDGLQVVIKDYLGFNIEKINNVLQFIKLSSKILLEGYTYVQS